MPSHKKPIFLACWFFSVVPLLAQQPELILPIGHTEDIFSTQYSSDGKYILTCSYDKTAKLWEASSGKLVNTFEHLHHSIEQIINNGDATQFSPDGKHILALTEEGAVKNWETASGRLIYSIQTRDKRIEKAEYSEDGKYILTKSRKIRQGFSPGIGEFDIAAELWDAKTGKYLHTIGYYSDFDRPLKSVVFSPSSKVFLKEYDSTLSICYAQTGRLIRNLVSLENYKSYEFTPDGKYVSIFPKTSNILRLWNTTTGRLSQIRVSGTVIFSPDSKYILSTTRSRVQLVDVIKGVVLYELERNFGVSVSPHFSDDGRYIYLSRKESMIRGDDPYDSTTTIWETSTGHRMFSLRGHGFDMFSVTFSSNHEYIATVSGRVEIWDATSGELLSELNTTGYPHFSPDGRTLAITVGNKVDIFNIALDRFLFSLQGHSSVVVSAQFSPDSKHILTTSNENNAKMWEAAIGRISRTFQSSTIVKTAEFSPNGKYVVIRSDDTSSLACEAETGKELFALHHRQKINSVHFSGNSQYIISSSSDSSARIWECETGRLIGTLHEYYLANDARFSPDGNYIITQTEGGAAAGWVWNNANPRFLYRLYSDEHKIDNFQFSPDGRYLLTISEKGTAELRSVGTGNRLTIIGQEYEKYHTEQAVSYISTEEYKNTWQNSFDHFSPDGKYVTMREPWNDYVVVWNVADINTIRVADTLDGHAGIITSTKFWKDDHGNEYFITLSAENVIKIWETGYREGKKSKLLATIRGHGFSISPSGKWLLVLDNVQLFLYDLSDFHLLYKAIAVDDDDYFIQPPNGLIYAATKNAARVLSFRFNDRVFSFGQFDLQFNRPDEVLQALASKDTALIRAYRNAYYKRMKRAGFREEDFSTSLHLPILELTNRRQIPDIVNAPIIHPHFKALDDQYSLDRYYVYVNGVPIGGIKGVSLRHGNIRNADKTIPVDLSTGLNKIEMSCMNSKGVESLKETFYVTYQPKVKQPEPKVYFVGIGVSNYRDSSMDLHYAAKDIRDLAKEFRKKYPSCELDTLIDANATVRNILAVRERLKRTAVEDKVFISISGHGLLDDSLNFHFATYDMNFGNPSQTGLLYDDLESLLDDIPARQKLLLIDACHSGEVDKGVRVETIAEGDTKGLRAYHPTKGAVVNVEKESVGLQNSFELMKELFADVSRSNGTVVISAAGGLEYALEDAKYNNGVFTYCIKMGLLEGAADKDGKNGITVNELKEYVGKKVEELTNGRQKPTTRKENAEFDWRVW